MVDNQACQNIAESSAYTRALRHIEMRLYFIRDHVFRTRIQLIHTSTSLLPSDIFTKALDYDAFNRHMTTLKGTTRKLFEALKHAQQQPERKLLELDPIAQFAKMFEACDCRICESCKQEGIT